MLQMSMKRANALACMALVGGVLLVGLPAGARTAKTEVLTRIGDHELCQQAPGLAGWLIGGGELWSLDKVLERGVDGSPVRAVVISFFATWCEPCKEGLPVLQRVRERYADDGVVFVLVALPAFDPKLPVERFLAALGVGLPTVKDKFGSLWERWSRRKASPEETTTLPRTVVVDARRRLVAVYGAEGKDFADVLADRLETMSSACP